MVEESKEEFLFWQIYPSFRSHAWFSHLPFQPWKVPHIFPDSAEGFPSGKKYGILLLTPKIFTSSQEGTCKAVAATKPLPYHSLEWKIPKKGDKGAPLGWPTFQTWDLPLFSHALLEKKFSEVRQHTEKTFIKAHLRQNSLWGGSSKSSASFTVEHWTWNAYLILCECSPFGLPYSHHNCYENM